MVLWDLRTWHSDVHCSVTQQHCLAASSPSRGTDTSQAPLAPSHPPNTKGSASSWSKRSGCLSKKGKALSQLCMATPNTQK